MISGDRARLSTAVRALGAVVFPASVALAACLNLTPVPAAVVDASASDATACLGDVSCDAGIEADAAADGD
jgi:hypothetical protein